MTYARESIDSPRAKSDQLHACRHKWQLHTTDYNGSSSDSSGKNVSCTAGPTINLLISSVSWVGTRSSLGKSLGSQLIILIVDP